MSLNKELINKIITVTSKAAISCNQFIGKNDKINADKAATDSMRNEVYAGAGIPEFYGVSIMELQEMGKGQRYNKIFAGFGPEVETPAASPVATFSDSTDEICLGLDRSRDVMLRAVATDAETGSEFSLMADDQYSVRQNKIGYYGSMEEGRMILDNRVLFGISL